MKRLPQLKRRIFLAATSLGLLTVGVACQTSTPTAPTAPVSTINTWRDARLVQHSLDAGTVRSGSGTSMMPIYGPETVLIITPLAFHDLEPEMQVLYVNHRGEEIVHGLVALTPRGWSVKGLNNPSPDPDFVTPMNYRGVVFGAFFSSGAPTAGSE